MYKYTSEEQLKEIKLIANEWSSRTRMNLGYDYYYKIIQKDVNNYIALGDENEFVGAYVKNLSDLDNDLPIINKSIREFFINNIPPEVTINNEDMLINYQKVVKVSSKYDYAIHNGKKQPEKTLRVFASKNKKDGTVYKYRFKNNKNELGKFANTPVHAFIDNSDIRGVKVPEKLDKSWYINLAWKRINQFMNE